MRWKSIRAEGQNPLRLVVLGESVDFTLPDPPAPLRLLQRFDYVDENCLRIPQHLIRIVDLSPLECLLVLRDTLGVVVIEAHSRIAGRLLARVSVVDEARARARAWSIARSYLTWEFRATWTSHAAGYAQTFNTALQRYVLFDDDMLEAIGADKCKKIVRFRDLDRLNCTRENLRTDESKFIPYGTKTPDSVERGIYCNPTTGRWEARRVVDRGAGWARDLGGWATQEQAVLAYHLDAAIGED